MTFGVNTWTAMDPAGKKVYTYIQKNEHKHILNIMRHIEHRSHKLPNVTCRCIYGVSQQECKI